MKLILDIETTRAKHKITGKDDPSPFNPANKLVTVQVKDINTGNKDVLVFNHKENRIGTQAPKLKLQDLLSSAELIVGHNLKFDLSWLLECGFKLPKDVQLHDTLIFEYVCNKGQKSALGLAVLAEKYNLPKKLDILQNYWEKGINTDEVPLAELEEYGLQDIETTYELYQLQRKRYSEDPDVKFMYKAIELTNEALAVVIEMERNGCYIDNSTLNLVEQQYLEELAVLDKGINTKIVDLMGDTPINLDSPDDMSALLYGLQVTDKKVWADKLGIGTSERNGIKKRKWTKILNKTELATLLKTHTIKLYKTEAEQCNICHGHKKIRKTKKDGEPFKKETICANCYGNGFIYHQTSKLAGLGLKPISTQFATAAGFAADKKVIEQYLSRESLDEETKAFLRALQRQSAIKTYLSTFIEGIRNNAREDGILHTSLNQCITATGRLSSSNPNFQNLPRGNTFPVRKVIKSRFDGGSILEVDFAGLEYRVAVMLAQCQVGLNSILSGKDRHQVTAEIIFGKKKEEYSKDDWKDIRQDAKSRTFKPLYGGTSGTEAEKAYYKAFMEEHTGLAKYQEELCSEAVRNHQIKTPFHRIFAFPTAIRKQDGNVTGKTQIVNYPVQSAATADIIWVVILDIFNEMKAANLKSKLILQVHDAVVADIHPSERELMINLFKKSFDKVAYLMYNRYAYKTEVPITSEMKLGTNWCEMQEVA